MSDIDKINELELSLQHAEEAISSLTSRLRRIQVEQAELSSNVSGLDETVEINRENVAQLDRWRETFNAMDYLDEGRAVWFESIGRRTVVNAKAGGGDFWVYLSGSAEATVTAGLYVIHPGVKKVHVAETTLSLSGDHEWIYVDHDRNTDAVSVVNQDLDNDVGPDPIDTQHLYWMLARYDKQASGAYSLARRTHNGGAIQWGSPL